MKIAHAAAAFDMPVTSHGAHGFGPRRRIGAFLPIGDGFARARSCPAHGIDLDRPGIARIPA